MIHCLVVARAGLVEVGEVSLPRCSIDIEADTCCLGHHELELFVVSHAIQGGYGVID